MKKNHIKPFFIRLIPLFCVCLVLLIDNFSVRLFGFSQSFLTNALGFIFCFTVFRVTAFNSILLFVLGLITDIILVFPLGFSSFIFCFVFFVAQFNRRFLQQASFNRQWLVFSLTIAAVFLFGTVFLKTAYGAVPHPLYLTGEFVGLILLYPFIAAVCGWLNKKMGSLT